MHKNGVFDERLGNLKKHHGKQFIATSHNAIEELDDSSLSGNFLRWKKAVLADQNVLYRADDSSSGNINVDDPTITIEVLGPKVNTPESNNTKMFEWFGDHSHTINGTFRST